MKWVSFPPGISLFCIMVQLGCNQPAGELAPSQPNIVWLVAEDQSPDYFPIYGDTTLAMPVLEKLAEDGVVFTRAYAPVPVCAPARSSIITGMYPTTLGTHNMRTYNAYTPENQPEIGIPSYSPIPPPGVRMFTEYLRKAGYYCSNNAKEDYNFKPSIMAWDESSPKAHWRNREAGQPFFAVFNFGVSHESQIWERGKDSLWVEPGTVPVPPYFPDNDTIRHDLAVNYSNLGRLDTQIGEVIRQLKEDGLYDNSYIFFYSDHGGPFPRQKRALYESGTRVPMVIKFPGGKDAGKRDDRLLSFIDLAPTILSIAGLIPPRLMQGKAQFGTYSVESNRNYLFSTSDRYDEMYDRLRAVHGKRYKYIRNYNPTISNALPVSYREQMPMMKSLRQLWENQKLDSLPAKWFEVPKPDEELYDLQQDPYELQNLAAEASLQDTLIYYREVLDDWIEETRDLGRVSEKDLLARWLQQGLNPELPSPEMVLKDGFIRLRSPRADATLIWKAPEADTWQFYVEPIPEQQSFSAKAIRLGFEDSEHLVYEATN